MSPPERSPAPHSFDHLYLEMTSKCNLRCKHCYMEGGLALENELRLIDWLRLVDEFGALGGRFLTLSGGESLMYPGWAVLGTAGRAWGMTLSLMTNGRYLDHETLATIQDLEAAVGLGLDGVTAATHDTNRGRGSFDAAMAALALLIDAGYERSTSICFTPMKFNAHDLPRLIELMIERGLPRLYISLLEERGRARFFKEKLALTEEQRHWLLGYLYDAWSSLRGRLHIEVTHHEEIFHRLRYGVDVAEQSGGTIRVTSNGELYLSAYMGAPEHCVGVAGRDHLETVLRSAETASILEAFEQRADRIRECRACEFKDVCRGGVGVLAHSRFGDFYVPDEYCGARKELFDRVTSGDARALANA